VILCEIHARGYGISVNLRARLSAILIASTVGAAALSGQSPTSIVGTWKVVKYEDRGADGTISHPYGENPIGYFVYDATGRLSVHIMRTPALKPFPGMREGTGDGASDLAFRDIG